MAPLETFDIFLWNVKYLRQSTPGLRPVASKYLHESLDSSSLADPLAAPTALPREVTCCQAPCWLGCTFLPYSLYPVSPVFLGTPSHPDPLTMPSPQAASQATAMPGISNAWSGQPVHPPRMESRRQSMFAPCRREDQRELRG